MTQLRGRARRTALALTLGLAAAAGGAAAQTSLLDAPQEAGDPGEFDKLVQGDDALQPRGDGSFGVEEDRSFYRTSRPRSPKALGFGASPTDPYRNRPSRPGLIYDEVLQTFREPFVADR